MTPRDPAPRRTAWARVGKWLRWIGATLVVLEIVYLIAGNLFLNFGLTRLTNFAPENMKMEVEGAFSFWPTKAHVRHYRLRAQDSAIQWVLEVDDADLTVDLLDLFKRKFHATRVRARDCSFRLRRKLDDAGAASPRARALVPIAGFADPPMLLIGPPEAPTTDADYRLWSAELEDVVTGAREIWIDEWQLLGPAEVVGSFYFKPARLLQLGPLTLDVHAGELVIDEHPTLRGLDVHIATTVEMIDLLGPLASAVRQISAQGRLSAIVPGADFLGLYLPPDAPARIEGGSGALYVDLRLEHGVALPPTAFRLESDRLAVAGASLAAVLSLTVEARVEDAVPAPTASGEIRVRDAILLRPGSDLAPPVVETAVALFRGLPRDLAGPFSIDHTRLDASATVPDLAALLPLPEAGKPAPLRLDGRGALRAEADLDGALRGSGLVEARADRVLVSTPALDVAGAVSARLAFDGGDLRERDLHLLPSHVVADDLTVTREGRAHSGGTVRIDLTRGSLRSGIPQDLALTLAARFADLRWLSLDKPGKDGGSATAHAGAATVELAARRPAALLDGSPEDAAITGSVALSASGAGRFRDVSLRGGVSVTTLVDGLDLGRRTLPRRVTHVDAPDVEIGHGHSHSAGWWATVDVPSLDGTAQGPPGVEARVALRCKSGEPFLAALASTGTIPGWVGSIFPMNDLSASADLSGRRGVLDLRLRVVSSSTEVRARLHDVGGAMDGAVFVDTAVVSVGVELTHGESHVSVFAGDAWLKAHMAAAEAPGGVQAAGLASTKAKD